MGIPCVPPVMGTLRGSGQSYGSVTISGSTSGLPMLWKGSEEPSPNFWGFGGGVVGLKLYILPMGRIRGQVSYMGPYP